MRPIGAHKSPYSEVNFLHKKCDARASNEHSVKRSIFKSKDTQDLFVRTKEARLSM